MFSLRAGQPPDGVDQHEVEERDVSAKNQHRHDDHDGRIGQLLVAAESFFLRIPRPRGFGQLDADFGDEIFEFAEHARGRGDQRSIGEQARRDSNPQPTVLETATLPIELLT